MSVPAPKSHGPVGDGEHVVRRGECLESIAHENGFFVDTLWNLPENGELKRRRENPNLLLPDDRVAIPDLRIEEVDRPTEKKHTFRRRGVPSLFRLRLLRVDEPRDDVPYRLKVDDVVHVGRTDAEGELKVPIAPDARRGLLILDPGEATEERHELILGAVDPITEMSGVQHRLDNLGFEVGAEGELDDETSGALASFQRACDLEPTGKLDADTLKELEHRHGS